MNSLSTPSRRACVSFLKGDLSSALQLAQSALAPLEPTFTARNLLHLGKVTLSFLSFPEETIHLLVS